MADVKKLQTRIALKYDTYANWTDEAKGANLVLLKGEMGICEIPSGATNDVTTAPTVLFKVGDGVTPFKTLKWASALAADVYGWAKAETVELVEVEEGEGDEKVTKQYLQFKTGDSVKHSIDMSSFATDAELTAAKTELAARIADIEAALGVEGDSEESFSARLETVEGAVETLTGEAEGSVKKALVDAKAYTDEVAGNYAEGENEASGLRGEIAAAEASAKAYTDTREAAINGVITEKVSELSAEDARLAGLIEDITKTDGALDVIRDAIAQEVEDREAADEEILDLIGDVTEGKTVVEMIAAAEAAAKQEASTLVTGLAEGAVAQNAADIADLQEAVALLNGTEEGEGVIAEINKAISDETDAREEADQEILDLIGTVTEGKTVAEMIAQAQTDAETNAANTAQGKVDALANGAVAANAGEIARVEGKFDEIVADMQEVDTDHEGRIAKMEAFFAGAAEDSEGLNDALDTLVEIQNLLSMEEGAAAGELLDAVTENAEAIEDIMDVIGDAEGGLVKDIADNAAGISALEDRATELEGRATELEGTVAGYDSTNTVKKAVDAAAELAQTGVNNAATAQAAAEAADAKAQTAQNEVDALETEVAGVKATAEKGVADAAAAQGTADQAVADAAAAQGTADTAVANAATAQAAAEAAQGTADTAVANAKTADDKAVAAQNAADAAQEYAEGVAGDLAALTNGAVADNAAAIEALQGDSHTHTFVESELNKIVDGDVAKWNEAYEKRHEHANKDELDLIATGDKAKWDAAATQAETNKTDIADHEDRLDTIESDYLKAADLFIIDCGSSTEVIHVLPTEN